MSAKWLLGSSFLLAGFAAFAEPPGSLTGVVLDPSDAGIPRAEVVLRSEKGSVAGAARTDTDGRFTFSGLAAGLYRIEVSATFGFKAKTVRNIAVRQGEVTRLPRIVLEIPFHCGPCTPDPPPRLKFRRVKIWQSVVEGKVVHEKAGTWQSLVEGKVVRAEGPPFPGVSVTMRRSDTGADVETVKAGSGGVFNALDLDPGTYTLRAQQEGFFEVIIGRVEVRRGQKTTIVDPLVMAPCPTGEPCIRVVSNPCPVLCID
jgi:hypothetical protein